MNESESKINLAWNSRKTQFKISGKPKYVSMDVYVYISTSISIYMSVCRQVKIPHNIILQGNDSFKIPKGKIFEN